ncbi:MAG: NfeD family protein [Lachnospiraceae bacterium]|nr:NfeD family protein [Lachnospiraceae bacterium]
MQAVFWLAALVVLLAIEAITLGLTTIWFAGGALIAFILALLQVDVMVQVVVFCAVSVVLLIFTRPAAARWLNRDRTRTNAQSLLGETAVVTERIDNLAGSGQVQVRGQFWTARAAEDKQIIEMGNNVTVEQISGVKLIVKQSC